MLKNYVQTSSEETKTRNIPLGILMVKTRMRRSLLEAETQGLPDKRQDLFCKQ